MVHPKTITPQRLLPCIISKKFIAQSTEFYTFYNCTYFSALHKQSPQQRTNWTFKGPSITKIHLNSKHYKTLATSRYGIQFNYKEGGCSSYQGHAVKKVSSWRLKCRHRDDLVPDLHRKRRNKRLLFTWQAVKLIGWSKKMYICMNIVIKPFINTDAAARAPCHEGKMSQRLLSKGTIQR